jgi:hypothetical protein
MNARATITLDLLLVDKSIVTLTRQQKRKIGRKCRYFVDMELRQKQAK